VGLLASGLFHRLYPVTNITLIKGNTMFAAHYQNALEGQINYMKAAIHTTTDIKRAIELLDGKDLILVAHVLSAQFGEKEANKALLEYTGFDSNGKAI
jgi:hypothetical protein